MFELTKKMFLACTLVLVVLTTGAWQSNHVVLAESQNTDIPETPLYPGLTWLSLGSSTQDIKININGDSISLSGERYEAVEQFISALPQDLLNYYSNEQLAKSGWVSYDTYNEFGGTHYVFYHESGVYLSLEFLKCPDVPSSICVAVWKSEQAEPSVVASVTSEPEEIMATATFGKTTPANGATNLNPASTVLSWEAYSPTPDKYAYCVKAGSACEANDPSWTSTYDRSITLTDLEYDKTYYWQVRAVTCVTCVPKTFVYANNGTVWTFKTKPASQAVIVGNAGVVGAVLSYTDVTLKTVTANGSGNYSITVPLNWSGTVTPAKSGYLFSPKSASFINLTAPQTIQNFIAVPSYTISGNVGQSGVTLSYTDGTPQTVTSDSNGNYSILVPSNWSGTVTPTHACYIFTPANRIYSNITTNQTAQNYVANFNSASSCANIQVKIEENIEGSYALAPGTSKRVSYPLDSGPVKVTSTNAIPMIAALRDAYFVNGKLVSFAQLMGLPVEQLSDTYYFPAYNNLTLDGQLRFANVGTAPTDVTVTIAGIPQGTYTLQSNEQKRVAYPLDSGPVVIQSTGNVPIIAALRDAYYVDGKVESFVQLMGLPVEALSDTYYFPAYNNVTLDGQLRFGNVGNTATDVTVTIAGVDRGTYTLQPNEQKRVSYTLDTGPVVIKSSGNVPIIAALRDAYYVNGKLESFAQLMGLPVEALSDTYYFPAYNNVTLDGQLRFGNVGNTVTDVTVTIGGVPRGTYTLQPNEQKRVAYPLDSGPVVIQSTGNVPIIAALRDAYYVSGKLESFVQLMGLPVEQLSATYYFPAYNNLTLDGQLRFGIP